MRIFLATVIATLLLAAPAPAHAFSAFDAEDYVARHVDSRAGVPAMENADASCVRAAGSRTTYRCAFSGDEAFGDGYVTGSCVVQRSHGRTRILSARGRLHH